MHSGRYGSAGGGGLIMMDGISSFLLPVLLPLGGAALAFIAAILHFRRIAWVCALAGTGSGLAVMLNTVYDAFRSGAFPINSVVGGWSPVTGIVVSLDARGAVLGPVLYGVSLLIMLYASGDKRFGAVFAGVVSIAVAGMGGVIVSGDLFNLFVFFEILSMCAVILIAYERRGHALYAALRYLLVASVSIVFYLVGLLLLYRVTGELAIERILVALQSDHSIRAAAGSRTINIGTAFILAAVATRVAIVPFHGWLPAAHGQAPTPVSAFLSGLMLKSGFLALWKVSAIGMVVAPTLMESLLILGVVSAILGAYMAFAQCDVKRLLAFSSISQMGFIVTALAAGAYDGALFHAVAHAVFKSLLFLVVGLAVTRYGTHDLDVLRRRRGIVPPGIGSGVLELTVFLIAAAAVAGVPGLSGFAGKELIAQGLRYGEGGNAALHYLAYQGLAIASMGTVATFLKLSLMYIPSRSADAEPDGFTVTRPNALRVSFLQAAPLVILAVAAVLQAGGRYDLIESAAVVGFFRTAAVGTGLFALSRFRTSARALNRIAGFRLGIDGALALVFIGVVLLAR